MSDASLEVLNLNLMQMSQSIKWLKRSFDRCRAIGIKPEYSDDEFDQFETFTSRYARTTDLVINKVLRSIDAAELLEAGSVIDAANRAEKRGIVDSVGQLRRLKDLRNEIAHEYETEDLKELFGAVLEAAGELVAIAEKIGAYCSKISH